MQAELERIDSLDRQIFELFQQRLEAVEALAAKKRAGCKPIHDPERERALYSAARKLAQRKYKDQVQTLLMHLIALEYREQRRAYNVYISSANWQEAQRVGKELAGRVELPFVNVEIMAKGSGTTQLEALAECAKRGTLVAAVPERLLRQGAEELMRFSGRLAFLKEPGGSCPSWAAIAPELGEPGVLELLADFAVE